MNADDKRRAVWELPELQWLQSLAEHIKDSPVPRIEDDEPIRVQLQVRVIEIGQGMVAEIIKDFGPSGRVDVHLLADSE